MKRLVIIALALVLVLGMPVGVLASVQLPSQSESATEVIATGQIAGVNKSFQTVLAQNAASGKILLNNKSIGKISALSDLNIAPGAEVKIYLTANMFTDSNGNLLSSKADQITKSQLTKGNIAVRATMSKGKDMYSSVAIGNDSGGTFVRLRFTKNFASVDAKEFDYNLRLTHKKVRVIESDIQIAGEMENPSESVDRYDDYFDISNGTVLEADEYISSIELELGDGVFMDARLYNGTKYYGVARMEIRENDEKMLNKYPDIEMIYRLSVKNLNKSGNKVKFDVDENFYVYNASGAYLGTTTQGVNYSNMYYLTSKKYDTLEIN